MKNVFIFEPIVTKEQIQTVSDLARVLWLEHYPPIVGLPQVEYMLDKFQSPEAIRGQIQEGFHYYLMLRDSTASGYFAFLPKPAGEIFLSKLYVKTEARGQGLARKAVTFLEKWAAENHYHKIFLQVHKRNTGSVAVYEHMGFVIAKALRQDIGHNFCLDDYRMEKTVGPAARP